VLILIQTGLQQEQYRRRVAPRYRISESLALFIINPFAIGLGLVSGCRLFCVAPINLDHARPSGSRPRGISMAYAGASGGAGGRAGILTGAREGDGREEESDAHTGRRDPRGKMTLHGQPGGRARKREREGVGGRGRGRARRHYGSWRKRSG